MLDHTRGQRVFALFNGLFLTLLMAVTLYPMIYVLMASLSTPRLFMAHKGILLVPAGLSLGSFQTVFRNPMIASGYGNTLFIVLVGLCFNITLTAFGAYFLSRKNLMLTKAVMFFIIVTMFFHGGLIPFYLTVKNLRLDNSLWALIFPVAINTFNLIILRTSFQSIPDSLEESAKLDGAGHFTILFRIILPLSLPTLAVIVLYYGVQHWNAWFNAMVFLRKRSMFPLQIVLREILIANDINSMQLGSSAGDKEMIAETIRYAVIVVATAPILFLYPFLQKYFVKGALVGAVKG